jgi:hypothetical protein
MWHPTTFKVGGKLYVFAGSPIVTKTEDENDQYLIDFHKFEKTKEVDTDTS